MTIPAVKLIKFALPLAFLAPNLASAVVVGYSLEYHSGKEYVYYYSVKNDGGSFASTIQGFQILFPDASNLSIVSPSAVKSQWDEVTLGATLSDPAAYDALAKSGGIPVGSRQSGFAVQFNRTGSGSPGSQTFLIYDPNTYDTVYTGTTVPVPEPEEWLMMMIGFGMVGWRVRASRKG